MLRLTGVHVSFGARRILEDVSLRIAHGQLVGLMGPNGAGKSTLLRAAAGLVELRAGAVVLDRTALDTLSRREVARSIAWLPQGEWTDLDLRVREVVLLGRYPHVPFGRPESEADRAIAERSMIVADVQHLAERKVPSLSAGELQRVLLARALTQEPRFMLLDEPTANLDFRYAWSILEQLRRVASTGVGVLAAVHDLSLAARMFDRIVVVRAGKIVADGSPGEALSSEVVADVFGMRITHHGPRDDLRIVIDGPV